MEMDTSQTTGFQCSRVGAGGAGDGRFSFDPHPLPHPTKFKFSEQLPFTEVNQGVRKAKHFRSTVHLYLRCKNIVQVGFQVEQNIFSFRNYRQGVNVGGAARESKSLEEWRDLEQLAK